MKTYLTIYFGTVLAAMILVPIVSRLAKRYHLVDVPGPRKVHKIPVPRIGGIVFVISTLALVLPVFFLHNDIGQSFRANQREYVFLLVSACLIFIMGFVDDLRSVPAVIKLLCLVGASLAICASGATVRSITVGSWFEVELGWMAWPLTVLWITTITVGMNFIDGLDGLAAGVAAIACGAIALLALWNGQVVMAVLMLALLGSLTGFLFFNFHPAKIFMGDGGAMFIGFMMGAGSLVCQAKTCTLVGLSLPALVLGVPILDAAFTVIRRGVLCRRSIFSAERGHLHHRLLDLGMPQATVAIIIYAITMVGASIGMLTLAVNSAWSLGLLAGGCAFIFAVFVWLGAARIRETIAAIKSIRARTREKKKDNQCFEDSQLCMLQAASFNAWWESLCLMAERMQFQNLRLSLQDNGHPTARYRWNLSEEDNGVYRTTDFTLPLDASGSEVSVRIGKNGSLEATCRRVTLLGRLMDEFPPPGRKFHKPIPQSFPRTQVVAGENEAGSSTSLRGGAVTDGPGGIPVPVEVAGVPVVPFPSYDEALQCIERAVESRKKSFWIAVNPRKCYDAWRSPELMDILRKANAGICDGVGVSVASKILHGRWIDRVTGCDLFFRTIALASQRNWRVFLLGASAESNAGAHERLREMYPDLQIVGRQDGYFEDSSTLIERINASKADLLFVAMGSPRQEYWIARHRKEIDAAFCMGVGGSFDVAAGKLTRAPKIFQKMGIEFLYQLVTEPRKRWRRQMTYFPFMLRIVAERFLGSELLKADNRKHCGQMNLPGSAHSKELKGIIESKTDAAWRRRDVTRLVTQSGRSHRRVYEK
ncbi:MAG: WecB/TagA/CpsF family glycosyltransferase [Planctomycetota bacterium]|jgi:exopolysaccharide biosynthesis WecB/TagA/CpsF family protein